jgi:hypothetical protein
MRRQWCRRGWSLGVFSQLRELLKEAQMSKRDRVVNAVKTGVAVLSLAGMSMAHAVVDTAPVDSAKADAVAYGTAIIGVVLAIVGFAWIRRVIK